jgi:hypothetical protein
MTKYSLFSHFFHASKQPKVSQADPKLAAELFFCWNFMGGIYFWIFFGFFFSENTERRVAEQAGNFHNFS